MPAVDWRGRSVLLTGHTGFKGGWLAWWLHTLGAQLHGYALAASTQPSLYQTTRVTQVFEREHFADLRDLGMLQAAMRAAQPDVIFHLAAQSQVPSSYRDPLESFSTNVMGTAHVLEAARLCDSVRAVVVVTSDKCYRELDAPHRESDPLGGHDPYSASKACAEIVSESYRLAFKLPQRGLGLATGRAGNVIGGGDWTAGRLLPDLLQAVSGGQPVRLRQPRAVRPWQHVLEPLAGYVTLAEHLLADASRYSGAFNFGPDVSQALPVSDITRHLLDLARRDGLSTQPAMEDAPTRDTMHEAPVLRLDAGKARQQLGWTGRLDAPAALELTWQWHQAWRSGQDMAALTRRQIDDYRAQVATMA